MATRDTRMIAESIIQRWETSPEMRKRGLLEMARILVSPTATNREKTSAFKAILAAEAQNQADEQHADDRMDEGRNRILDLLGRSGPSQSPIIVEPGGKRIADKGDQQPSQRKPNRKNKGRRD